MANRKHIKTNIEVNYIMKNQLLKTISELSPNAAYWMGKRDGYKAQILGLLQQITVADLAEKQAELKSLHWWLDLTNDNFSKEMGWN
ncbi:hypothetical protein [Limosilactobacillus reuteri]|nr:hypothetical protein [Limosilactobacillus reuteri]MCH5379963.1 hypothetical protein [Limosilactobacillus reuteri]MRI08103.1 hypothetical protein [Limosilactobacillus reuteri]OCW65828.1 hypothetical protein BBP10_00250 [Limosilactobacillus reuteri]OCW70650.1 hypothetical protein BBP13_05225 [Limosilactobacillus reuteri]